MSFGNHKMEDFKLLSFVLFFVLSVVNAGDFCYTDYNDYTFGNNQWCEYGCCGTYNNICCGPNVGAVVGIVVGSVFAVIIVVSIIITICCCICCKRSQAQNGTVYQQNYTTQPGVNIHYGVQNQPVTYGAPTGQNNMGFVHTTTTTTSTAVQQPAPPNRYAQPPPSYEELRVTMPPN